MKQIICCLLLLCTVVSGYACDVCGGSGSSQSLGILPGFNKHFIGLQYQYRNFSSIHPSLNGDKPAGRSEEQYNTVQVWARYAVSSRLQLFAFVPYQYNRTIKDGRDADMSGLGDISILANATIVRTNDSNSGSWKQILLAGGGVKAPTGSYQGSTALDRQGLPNMQPGSGAWDFMANMNYTLRNDQMGLNTDVVCTVTAPNKDDYKYGDRLSTAVTGFYSFSVKQVSLMPQVGIRYEYVLHDYDNYTRKWLNEQTGGNMLYATAGCSVYYLNTAFQLSYGVPVGQYYGGGNVTAKHRVEASLFFLF